MGRTSNATLAAAWLLKILPDAIPGFISVEITRISAPHPLALPNDAM
jgi:Mg2+/citrate symporter